MEGGEQNNGLNILEAKSGYGEKGLYTRERLSNEIGITPKTFTNRLKKGVFNSDEICVMIQKLDISDPMNIFLHRSNL